LVYYIHSGQDRPSENPAQTQNSNVHLHPSSSRRIIKESSPDPD
jgi:hypothetical protein